MITRMQQRRGTSLEWQAVADTIILASGEIGLETDTGHYKVGDGTTVWTNLPYFTSDRYNSDVYAKLNADQDFFGTQNFVQPDSEKIPIIARGLAGHNADLQQWDIESTEIIDPNESITEKVVTKVASMSADGILDLSGITVSGDIILSNGAKIRGLVNDNLQDDEAVNKSYVDTIGSTVAVSAPVRLATTENIVLSGLVSVDSVATVAGDRILVKAQTDKTENGIYVVSSGSWSRAADMDDPVVVKRGVYVLVLEGSENTNKSFVLTTEGSGASDEIVFGTDEINFELFFNPGAIIAGNGISQSGLAFNVVGTPNEIDVSSSGVSISDTYTGQSSITTVGTIAAGIWNGSPISVAYGGTGAESLTGFVYGNGTGAFTADPKIDGFVIRGDISGKASNVTGTIDIANGGTNATTAEQARTNLGVAPSIHSHVASQITDQHNLVAGRIYAGGVQTGRATRIFIQSSTPSSASEGDLWFW